jgi:hypothetical protein
MTGDLLAAGQSLSGFAFDSTETPTQLFGPSPFFQKQTETTSAAYKQGPFSDATTAGDVFVVTPSSTTGNGDGGNDGGGNDGGGGGGMSAVPLPAAAWQVLAVLGGLAMIAGGKKLKNYILA